MNLFLFIGLCFVLYLLFRHFHFGSTMEGMTTDASGSSTDNGIAGNSASYAASLKSANIKSQDIFLISKYRTDYETAILNLDEFIDNLMLNTSLTVDPSNPNKNITQLAELNQAKIALNNVMKYIDKK